MLLNDGTTLKSHLLPQYEVGYDRIRKLNEYYS